MMNVLFLVIVFTSIFASDIWSPPPFIGQLVSGDNSGKDSGGDVHLPGELICDALGKCKHKIARAFTNAKDKVTKAANEDIASKKETVHEAKKKIEDVYDKAKESAHEAVDFKKEMAREAKHKIEDIYEEAKECAIEKAQEAKERLDNVYDKAKETSRLKAQEIKEGMEKKAKEDLRSLQEIVKTIQHDIAENVTENIEIARNEVKNIINKVLKYIVSLEGLSNLMGLVNYLGFTVAYGMCIWVTFISSYLLASVLPRQLLGVVQSKIYRAYFRSMAVAIGAALFGHLAGKRGTVFTNRADVFQAINLLVGVLLVLPNLLYLEPLATKAMFEAVKLEKEEGRRREGKAAEPRTEEKGKAAKPRTEEELQQQVSEARGTGASTTETTVESEAPMPAPGCPEAEEEFGTRIDEANKTLKRLNSYSSFLNILTIMTLSCQLVYTGLYFHSSSSYST